ncbi:LppM family (lipo)protein [Actinomyces gaoshouyii]|uniref:LppM domain-containing protein n=1 Tax=Actinomyces gaoshouyii TaxID=1960083 RepID=A0A8H9HCK9_9ACTO|nr:hypothetical protein [Actinomyces gaoshouyii]GGO95672.1 hypothetical protein GCM10011612_04090 [Actinomyces gaoshouyii]
MATSPQRRKLTAALLLPTAALALAACGGDVDFVIHDNDTFDLTMVAWDSTNSGLLTKQTCTEETMAGQGFSSSNLPDGAQPTYTFGDKDGSPSCTLEMKGIKLSDTNSSGSNGIKHEGDTYVFNWDASDMQDSSQGALPGVAVSLNVTFPGEVIEHNGSSTVDGTKVTWKNIITESESTLHAVGKDKGSDSSPGSSDSKLPLILGIGAVVALLVIGGIVAAVITSKKKAAASALPYGAPAAPGQPMQPGYAPTVDYGAALPGQQQYGQVGYPQQNSQVGQQDGQQPPQQPYGGQH